MGRLVRIERVAMGKVGEEGEFDQNTLYKILKELANTCIIVVVVIIIIRSMHMLQNK